jgi:transcriptional regulator with XRE-family HTH domain
MTNFPAMKLGEKMRHIREAKNLSQESVAEMMNMSLSGYAKLERGDTDIPWSRVEDFAKRMEVKPWEVTTYGEGIQIYGNNANSTNGMVGYSLTGFTVNHYNESDAVLRERIERLEAELAASRREVAHLEEINALLKK